jgi:hypothetical protein
MEAGRAALLTGLLLTRQRPQRGVTGVLYARYRTGAWGSGGLESAQHLLTLSPVTFGICIK